MQAVRERPFDERAGAILVTPPVSIAREARNHAAATIVAQHYPPTVGVDVESGAAALRTTFDGALRVPVIRVEPGGTQIARSGPVI